MTEGAQTDLKGLVLLFLFVVVPALGAGAGGVTTARHFELVGGFQGRTEVSGPCSSEGRDVCGGALTDPRLGRILGIPTAVWGTAGQLTLLLAALVFAGSLVLGARALGGRALVAALVTAHVAAAGTVAFLVIILVSKTFCRLCLIMHAFNGAALVVTWLVASHWWRTVRAQEATRGVERLVSLGLPAAVAGAAWLFIAVVVARVGWASVPSIDSRMDARVAQALWRCPQRECISPLVLPPEALPRPDEAVRLAAPEARPALVQVFDVSCPVCKGEYKASRALFREVMASRESGGLGSGVWFLLRPRDPECNPGWSREWATDGAITCERNAAFLCAAETSPGAALRFLDFEVDRLDTSVYDREQWLRENGLAEAARCLRDEVSRGYPKLKAHAAALDRLRGIVDRTHPECVLGSRMCPREAECPWWCLRASPAAAVVRPDAGEVAARAGGGGLDAVISEAAGSDLKWKYLRSCLQ